MDEYRLIIPDERFMDDVMAYKREMLAADSSLDGSGSLRRVDSGAQWLANCRNMENESTVPPGLVSATQYVFAREGENRVLGMLQLRHRLNDDLLLFGGHIGYSVRPSERRRGYATAMLTQALDACRERGLTRVLVTCLVQNEASRRVILACGGCYENTVYNKEEDEHLQRYWITVNP